jgi:hypothetical protein
MVRALVAHKKKDKDPFGRIMHIHVRLTHSGPLFNFKKTNASRFLFLMITNLNLIH